MASCIRAVKDAEEEEKDKTGPNWLELPRDVTSKILKNLGVVEIATSVPYVCPLWWNICKDPLMWSTIHISNRNKLSHRPRFVIKEFCCYAIDQSRGHLQDFNIVQYKYCSNGLLNCMANSQLLRLRLFNCRSISDKGLSEVANKLPLLEELDISFNNLYKDSLEVIGGCCPSLIVLKYNKLVRRGGSHDDEALAIAKTMPKLRHLELSGSGLSNDALFAILDGCHQLTSLDLCGCFNVHLRGSLGKRCHGQIKDLRLPDDYIPQFLYNEGDDYYYGGGDYTDYDLYPRVFLWC